jgi:hypothetical protein
MCNRTTIKQAQDNMNPFANVLLLLVGDLAQLLAICKHSLKKHELYYKLCHISMAPCWSNASHHILQTSMRHITNPIFLQFLNMIHIKKPTQNEIDNVFSCCYVSKTEVLSHINSDTNILCSHRKDVNKYNDLIVHKMFHANEIFDVMIENNAMVVENWLHDF